MKGTTKAMLIGGATALGVPALANALIYSRRGELTNPIQGEKNIYKWKLGNIVYRVAGEGEPVVLVHGVSIGNSSYEWRNNLTSLSANFKVYALDMLGFGESDKPSTHYDARLYVDLLTDFVIDVVDEPTDIIASSHGGAFSIIAARKHKPLIRKLVLVCPTGIDQLAGQPTTAGKALSSAMSVPVFGTSMYYSMASRENIAKTLKQDIYFDPDMVTTEMVDHYYAASHQPGADKPARAFISGMMNLDVKDAFSRIEQPTMIVWGREAKMSPVQRAQAFLETNPRAQLKVIEECGLIPHAEKPEEFNTIAREWLTNTHASEEQFVEYTEEQD